MNADIPLSTEKLKEKSGANTQNKQSIRESTGTYRTKRHLSGDSAEKQTRKKHAKIKTELARKGGTISSRAKLHLDKILKNMWQQPPRMNSPLDIRLSIKEEKESLSVS